MIENTSVAWSWFVLDIQAARVAGIDLTASRAYGGGLQAAYSRLLPFFRVDPALCRPSAMTKGRCWRSSIPEPWVRATVCRRQISI